MTQSPIIVDAPTASEVPEELQNDIIIAVIFKLKPGTTNKRDESAHIVLKEFPYATVSEERKSYLENELNKIYHHMLLEDFDAQQFDFRCLQLFQEKMERTGDKLWMDRPLDQQVYVKFKKGKSVGCGHYIRGCQMQCFACKEFVSCRICHDDVADHEFPRFQTTTLVCSYCGTEQPLAQKCSNCGRQFGYYFCDKCKLICGIGPDAKPNFHADCCKICLVGFRDMTKHCDKCDNCYSRVQFNTHKCVSDSSDCIICLGSIKNSIYGRVILTCGHGLHQHCYSTLLQQGNFKCPVCRKFLPLENDREMVLRWQLKNYEKIVPLPQYQDYFVRVKCNDCQREFCQRYHPLYYYCPECKMFNCDAVDDIHPAEGATKFREFQKQYPNTLQPRESTVEGVKQALVSAFGIEAMEVERYVGMELNMGTLQQAIEAVNRLPKTLEEFKAIFLTGATFE